MHVDRLKLLCAILHTLFLHLQHDKNVAQSFQTEILSFVLSLFLLELYVGENYYVQF